MHTPWPLCAPLQLFPYHLAEYVCRMMRLTPFRYYSSLLADAMREDLPYDAIPNFTVSLGVLLGGGRGTAGMVLLEGTGSHGQVLAGGGTRRWAGV